MGDFYILSLFFYLYKQDIKAANQLEQKQAIFSVYKGEKQNQVLFKYSTRFVFLLHL